MPLYLGLSYLEHGGFDVLTAVEDVTVLLGEDCCDAVGMVDVGVGHLERSASILSAKA